MTRSLDWELGDQDLRLYLPIICVFGQILYPKLYLLRNCPLATFRTQSSLFQLVDKLKHILRSYKAKLLNMCDVFIP